MRILLISFYFPPYNSIGAVRVGKTAKFLRQFGHDVRVLTATGQPFDASLPLEVPGSCVTAVRYLDMNRPLRGFRIGRARLEQASVTPRGDGGLRTLLQAARRLYANLANIPDAQMGWYAPAVRAGRRLLRSWQPDIILASAWPATAFLVARTLARQAKVPWVAEYRDLWSEHPYSAAYPWRRAVESAVEDCVVGSATGLVTVSEPLAVALQARFRRAPAIVLNGFDAADQPAGVAPDQFADPRLTIVYTGMIYPGKRDPTPLFVALARMGREAREVVVRFAGRNLDAIPAIAREHGVESSVEVLGQLPYAQSLRIQAEADALLMLMWNDPSEAGVFTGKLFEYVGARRPILVVGCATSAAACLVVQRSLGDAADDPDAIVVILRRLLARKRAGGIPLLPAGACDDLSREAQTRRLERYLLGVVRSRSPTAPTGSGPR